MRFDPFDLLFGRLSFQGEVAVIGPLAIEIEPSWIWGTPRENVDESGFAIAANIGVYFDRPLRGFWLKGRVGYESYEATLTAPVADAPPNTKLTDTKQISSPILGLMIGSTSVLGPQNGRNGGFAISGGVGIGVALADPQSLAVTVADAAGNRTEYTAVYYDGVSRIQLLGSLGLGVAF